MKEPRRIVFGDYGGATITVTVRPSHLLRIRTRIGLWLIYLGCRIATIGYAQEVGEA